MSSHNMCFYGELMKIILQLSSNTLLICSSVKYNEAFYHNEFIVAFTVMILDFRTVRANSIDPDHTAPD